MISLGSPELDFNRIQHHSPPGWIMPLVMTMLKILSVPQVMSQDVSVVVMHCNAPEFTIVFSVSKFWVMSGPCTDHQVKVDWS